MRFVNAGEAMVLSPKLLPRLGTRADEENRNSLSQPEDNSHRVASHSISIGANLNNNEASVPTENDPQRQHCLSESNSITSSSDDSLEHYQGSSSSSIDISPQGNGYQCFSQEDATDSDFSDDGNYEKEDSDEVASEGIANPNYLNFTDYESPSGDATQDKINDKADDTNGNAQDTDRVNHLDGGRHFQKDFYDKPKFEGCVEIVQDLNIVNEASESENSVRELNVVTGSADTGHENVFPEINFVISSTEHKFEFSPKESYQDSGVCSAVTTDSEFESFETSFLVKTTLFPVSGVFETAVLPEDESDVTPSPSDELKRITFPTKEVKCVEEKESDTMELAVNQVNTELEESSKLAKNSANERKMVKEAVEKNKGDVVLKADGGRVNVTWRSPSHGKALLTGEDPKPQGRSVLSKRDAPLPLTRAIPRKPDCLLPDPVLRRVGAPKHRGYSTNRRSVPSEKKATSEIGLFDVYNIETAMPNFDLEAIECHLKAAKEEEQRRRNDREEIRRRLAMGPDSDDFYCGDRGERAGRKPSLQSRLQGGMNLQICFMNDTGSDSESPSTDADSVESSSPQLEKKRPSSLPIKKTQMESLGGPRPSPSRLTLPLKKDLDLRTEADLFACQARLQSEARQALMQAKEMARMQMEVERQKMPLSPITQMVRTSLLKVGVPFPEERRRLSRQILTEMNVAQLQIIINDLHSQIEVLNENLVEYLMSRDDLHMEQDSMLVDIEDLTRYIGAKEKMQEPRNAPENENRKSRGMQMTLQNTA